MFTSSAPAKSSFFEELRRPLLRGFVALGLCLLAVGCFLSIGPRSEPVPLLRAADWQGDFFAERLAFPVVDVPERLARAPEMVSLRSWSPKTQGIIGEAVSAPFELPEYLAVLYAGFPSERPGGQVALRCEATGAKMNIGSARTNAQWATVYLRTGGFCPGPARIVATASDTRYYVGVSTPYSVSAADYYGNVLFAPRALVAILTWAIFAGLGVIFGVLAPRIHRALNPVAAGFAGCGLVGMSLLAAFTHAPAFGIAACHAVGMAEAAGLVALFAFMRTDALRFVRDHRAGGLLWLGLALAYAGFACAADSGGGNWAINALFSPLRWSSDNQLPMILMESLIDGSAVAPPTPGTWQATDRGPLLAVLLALPRVLLAPLVERTGLTLGSAYMISAITVLASWSVALVAFCRSFGVQRMAALTAIAAASPFLIFNTVYVWPKLLGGCYAVMAFLLLTDMRRGGKAARANLALVALCAVFAILAHGSNIYILAPMALLHVATIFGAGLVTIGLAFVAAAAAYAPWAYWQVVLQPGGNALMLYALTNRIDLMHRHQPFGQTILESYRLLGWQGVVEQKKNAVKLLFDFAGSMRPFPETAAYGPGNDAIGQARVLDFFVLARALGLAALGNIWLMAQAFAPKTRNDARWRDLAFAALTGASGIVFALVVSLPESFVHHQAYGAALLLLLSGGAALVDGSALVARISVALALAYALVVWIVMPLVAADHVVFSAVLGVIAGFVVIALGLEDRSRDEDSSA